MAGDAAALGGRGPELAAAVPLALLGITAGNHLDDLRAYVAPGDTDQPGPALDQLALTDTVLPQRTVTVLLEADDTTTQTPATLQAGAYTATLDTTTLPPEPLTIHIHVCLDQTCTTTTVND